ncbi:MAG: hypothetical protein ABIL58_07155 [Pseudomonadota bacterium]
MAFLYQFKSMAREKAVSANSAVEKAQRQRLKVFGLSVATYAVALLATFLITQIGIGKLTIAQWTILIGLCLSGIALFLILFSTSANLRFPEPSLTREQIVYASIYGIVAMYCLPDARPIILLFFLPPFSFGVLSLTLRQYLHVDVWVMGLYAALLCVEYFQDCRGFNIQYQLFLYILFGILLSWFAFFGGFVSNIRQRLQAQKKEIEKANEEIHIEMEERKRAQVEKDNLIIELKSAVAEVKTLSGLLPICSHCKKIRDDKGYWDQIEGYIQKHSNAKFSHGICPECAKKHYPDFHIAKKTQNP